MKKVLLDACVWLDYFWQKKAKIETNGNASKKLIDILNGDKKIEIILSPFLIREISSHFKDWFLLQQVVKNCFSFNDFKKEKYKFILNDQEKNEIDDIIVGMGRIKNVNALENSGLSLKEIERILTFESEYGFDIYDAIHLNTAIESGCDCLITKDAGFRRSAGEYNKICDKKIEIFSPKSFIKVI